MGWHINNQFAAVTTINENYRKHLNCESKDIVVI